MVEKKCDHIQVSCDLSGDAFDGLELKNVSYKEVHESCQMCHTSQRFLFILINFVSIISNRLSNHFLYKYQYVI